MLDELDFLQWAICVNTKLDSCVMLPRDVTRQQVAVDKLHENTPQRTLTSELLRLETRIDALLDNYSLRGETLATLVCSASASLVTLETILRGWDGGQQILEPSNNLIGAVEMAQAIRDAVCELGSCIVDLTTELGATDDMSLAPFLAAGNSPIRGADQPMMFAWRSVADMRRALLHEASPRACVAALRVTRVMTRAVVREWSRIVAMAQTHERGLKES
jgi:hypothetical protein